MDRFNEEALRAFAAKLVASYPNGVSGAKAVANLFGDDPGFEARATYLREYGLIDFQATEGSDRQIRSIKLTTQGLDWMLPGGGLAAWRKSIVVRFDEVELRALLMQRVAKSGSVLATKKKLIQAMRSLPSEKLGDLVKRCTGEGLKHIPDMDRWLQRVLGEMR